MARRILIKGGSGAGKTTLGRQLAEQLAVPFIELDALHHGPGWVPASAEQLSAQVCAALDDQRGWVVDGNYDGKLQNLVIDRAELILWLDLPLSTKLRRLIKRSARRWLLKERLWNGNREHLQNWFCGWDSLFPYAIRSHFHQRRNWPTQLPLHKLTRLRNPTALTTWQSQFSPPNEPTTPDVTPPRTVL
jgi:adenylate kinase family enzyme